MKLRFKVNQAEALRRGFDVPKSIVHLEVDPSHLPPETREMLADSMVGGIDVCVIASRDDDQTPRFRRGPDLSGPELIEVKEPTLDALLRAVTANYILHPRKKPSGLEHLRGELLDAKGEAVCEITGGFLEDNRGIFDVPGAAASDDVINRGEAIRSGGRSFKVDKIMRCPTAGPRHFHFAKVD